MTTVDHERPSSAPSEPIAVIGMAGRLPAAPDLERFWSNLTQRVDCFGEVPADRWTWTANADDPDAEAERARLHRGAFIADADGFDAAFFGITPKEAEFMDPQHRVFLETAWAAIEDAGYPPSRLAGRRVAVFVGVSTQDHRTWLDRFAADTSVWLATGIAMSMLANRVSWYFDFRGPSDVTDTACSSALTALHRAVQAIRREGCELALAGGVNLILIPDGMVAFDMAGMLSRSGRMRAFDQQADGYVRGEGVGAVLLKRLDRALADGDPVQAVIRGTASSHNGRGFSLTAPDIKGQTRTILDCFADAGLSAEGIGYVEAHGTASPVGDAVELRALQRAFSRIGAPVQPCKVGAVKNDIGQLEAASGMASLFKVVLALREGVRPGLAHLRAIHRSIKLAGGPFVLSADDEPWPLQEGPRRASIHAYGMGGVNAHVVVEEAPPLPPRPSDPPPPYRFAFSARTPEALRRVAQRWAEWLRETDRGPRYRPADVAHTLRVGREALPHRLELTAADLAELAEALDAWLDGAPAPHAAATLADPGAPEDSRELRRVAGLPTTPFERRRCRVEAVPGGVAPSDRRRGPRAGAAAGADWRGWLEGQLSALFGFSAAELEARGNFFELGLDSLSLNLLRNHLATAGGVDVPFEAMLRCGTLEGMAAYLATQRPVPSAAPRGAPGDGLPPRAPLADDCPLSPEQLRYWRHHQLGTDAASASLTVSAALIVERRLDEALLRRALRTLARHQPALNTTFHEQDGEVRQRYHDPPPVPLQWWEAAEPEEAVRRLTEELLAQPWDLAGGPLWRLAVVAGPAQTHLLLCMHHIVSDLASVHLFFDQLSRLYEAWERGESHPLPTLPRAFADYVWAEATGPAPPTAEPELAPLELPFEADHRRQLRSRAARVDHPIPERLASRLEAACRDRGVTPFLVFLGATHLLLSGLGGRDRVSVGLPLHNRRHSAWNEVIGSFARVSFATLDSSRAQTGAELLRQCAEALQALHAAPPMPTASGRRDPRRPLLPVMLNHARVPSGELFGAPSTFRPLGRALLDFDLAFTLVESDGRVTLHLEYAEELFSERTARRVAARFEALLTGLVDAPEQSPRELQARAGLARRTLAIAATFTQDPLEAPLRYWVRALDLDADLHWAGFDQVFQSLLDPGSALRRNRGGVNALLIRPYDWRHAGVEQTVEALIAALRAAMDASPTPTLVALCPDPEDADPRASSHVAARLREALGAHPQLTLLTADAVLARYPVTALHHPTLDALGGGPYRPAFFTALATSIARFWHLRQRAAPKVWVVDGDQTLWAGVVAEDGPDRLAFGRGRSAFHQKLLALRDSGALLCLCSKNAAEDVDAVFERRRDLMLRREHFVAIEASWQSKSTSLRDLARRLDLGLEDFVLVDDNPLELAEVAARCPQVLGLRFPTEEAEIARFCEHLWLLDPPPATREDRVRSDFYRQEAARAGVLRSAPSYAEFLAGLQLRVDLHALIPAEIPRVAQLSRRTNQFNSSGVRYDEAELAALARRDDHAVETVTLSDRFGDYGLVGATVTRFDGDRATVEAMYLSCRALGRGVEHAMLAGVARRARERGAAQVELVHRVTARNQPIGRFVASLGPAPGDGHPRFSAADLANTTFVPSAPDAGDDGPPDSPAAPAPTVGAAPVDLAQVERWLAAADIEALTARVSATEAYLPPAQPHGQAPPQTATERRLAEVFATAFGAPGIGVETPFYALGVGSLEVIRALALTRDVFDVPLPMQVLVQSATIRRCAEQIDAFLRHGAFTDQYARDWATVREDARLPPDLERALRDARPPDAPVPAVLLTGATGFLGAYLLRALLDAGAQRVVCLVRAADVAAGWDRLRDNLGRFNLWAERDAPRVEVLCGDFAAPRLGLDAAGFDRLGRSVGAIYHCGAAVDFSLPYAALRAANVVGTLECLRLACAEHRKALHYVSTASVFDAERHRDASEVFEQPLPEEGFDVYGGYAQTKWVAERLVSQAASVGLPATVYRPNGIGPAHTVNQSGFNLTDALSQILLASLNTGAFFDLPMHVDFAPVDYVAKALVALGRREPSPGTVYSLAHPRPRPLAEVIATINRLGQPVRQVAWPDWLRTVEAYAHETKDRELQALLPLMQEPLTLHGASWVQLSARRPRLDCANAVSHLEGSGVSCPPIDADFVMELLLLAYVTTSYRESVGSVLRDPATTPTAPPAPTGSRPVVLLTWSLGEGHNATARVIAEGLQAEGDLAVTVDLGQVISFVGGLGRLWDRMSREDVAQLDAYTTVTQTCRQHELVWFRTVFRDAARRLHQAYRPAAVVSVCPLGSQLLRYFKELDPELPTVTCITDWFGGSYKEWADPGADWIHSPSPQATAAVLAASEDPAAIAPRIHRGSLVLRAELPPARGAEATAEARERLGVAPRERLLIMNTYGNPQALELLAELPADDTTLRVLVLCYRNPEVLERLGALQATFAGDLDGRLWVDDLPDWLLAADVLFTKPGPGICAEAIMGGTVPWLDARGGVMPQEVGVHQTLLSHRWAVDVRENADFGRAARAWLQHAPSHRQVRDAVAAADLKNGGADFVRFLRQRLGAER